MWSTRRYLVRQKLVWKKNDNYIQPNLTAYDQVGLVYKPCSTRLAGLEILTDAENAINPLTHLHFPRL